jgi:hypothetical protein
MSTEVVVSIISGIVTIISVILTIISGNRRAQHNLEMAQKITDTKLDALTAEVKEHNNFAKRMPVVEEQIKVINHRLADLEKQ